MRTFGLFLLLFAPLGLFGDSIAIPCTLVPFSDQTHSIDQSTGIIANYPLAKSLTASTLTKDHPMPTFDPKTSSVIIHVVVLASTQKVPTKNPNNDHGTAPPKNSNATPLPNTFAITVKASHWYAVDPIQDWSTNPSTRLYGTNAPFILIIFLSDQQYDFSPQYSYTFAGRNPAPIQDLTDAAKLFEATVNNDAEAKKGRFTNINQVEVVGQACISQLSVTAPGAIDVTPKIEAANTAISIDEKPTEFDDEGFYHWDVSVGVPIISYPQLQAVTAPGADLTANVDKRNLFLLGDWYVKPVDVKNNALSKVPYIVAGASVASKPLHSILAGVGWGPKIANFYGGFLIITNNLPNHQTERVIKGTFGINLPVRTILGKLGINTQATSGK